MIFVVDSLILYIFAEIKYMDVYNISYLGGGFKDQLGLWIF